MRKPDTNLLTIGVRAFICFLLVSFAHAEVKPHALFSENAVLQQQVEVPVWGTAADGEKVTVEIQDQKVSATAKDGRWMVRLKPLKAGGPFTMTFRGANTITLTNILVGEVWICSGQSNMVYPLASSIGGPEAIAASKDPLLRLLVMPRQKGIVTGDKPLRDPPGAVAWIESQPEGIGTFGGVPYFFGRDLRKARGVPVGLIQVAEGSSQAQLWMPRPILEKPEYRRFLDEYDKVVKDYPAVLAEYKKNEPEMLKKYEETVAKLKAENNPNIPRAPQPPPVPGNAPKPPSGYYYSLIVPIQPFAMRGVIWYQGGNKAGIAMMLNNIGIIHDSQGNHAQAVEYFRKSLTMSETLGDKPGIERSLNNLGLSQHHQGNYAQALEYYQKSLAISEALGNKAGISAKLVNIGLVYRLQGNYAQAMEYYQKSLTLSEALGDKAVIAKLLNNIGSVYHLQGNYAQALEYYQKSLAVKESLGDKAGIAPSLYNIGLVHSQQGNHAQALEYFQKSLVMNEALGKKSGIADTLKSIATVHRSQGNYAQALEFAERAATLARTIGENEPLWESLVAASRAYRQLNKPVEARQALEEAIAIIEMLRTQVAGGEEEQQRFFASKLSPYHAMIDLLSREGRPAEALTFAERAKARVLLDVLQTGRANVSKALTGDEQEQERKLRAELISLNTQVGRTSQKDNPDSARLDELKSLRQKARLNYEAFQTSLYAAHPKLRVQRGEALVINAEELGALLPDAKSALLEYFVTEDVTFLFAITKAISKPAAEVRVFILPAKQVELAKQTESLRRQLAERDLGFRTSAKQLYQLLLKPAHAQLQGKTNLVIVPDDKLWELPFQALVAENGRYVIETSAVSYAPSLTVLREMRAQRGRHQDHRVPPTLLALGNPALGQETIERSSLALRDGKLDPLPEAEAEVKALGQLYGAARSKVYVGVEAREDRAKTEASQAGILHFATHGILNDASPMYSHLVLASGDKNEDGQKEDGLLEAWELMQLDLKADLAVLSACETARGRMSAGEGVIGLTWALFVAGVPTTVVSQWKVESAGTRELMVNFHQALQTRSTKAEALRQAALRLMKKTETNHPFYWAGFVLIGDGR